MIDDVGDLMAKLYAAGAVDLERTSHTIGFERKRVRADIRRGEPAGGQALAIDGGYIEDPELRTEGRE